MFFNDNYFYKSVEFRVFSIIQSCDTFPPEIEISLQPAGVKKGVFQDF